MELYLRITARERQALVEQYRKGVNPRVRLRVHILLSLVQGYPWTLVAGVLFCRTRTIAHWKKRVETGGMSVVLGAPALYRLCGWARGGARSWPAGCWS
jgi:hypothetical protein